MMRRRVGLAAVFACVGMMVADGWSQEERTYSPVGPERIATDPMDYDGKMLQIKDYYLEPTRHFSRWARKNRISSKTYLSFETDDADGSHMQCYVPKADEDLVKLVKSLAKHAQITVWGRLTYDYDAGIAHFVVDRIVKGHVDRLKKDKLEIYMTVEGKKWRISKSGKYRIAHPKVKEGVIIEFDIRLNGRVVK